MNICRPNTPLSVTRPASADSPYRRQERARSNSRNSMPAERHQATYASGRHKYGATDEKILSDKKHCGDSHLLGVNQYGYMR